MKKVYCQKRLVTTQKVIRDLRAWKGTLRHSCINTIECTESMLPLKLSG